MSCITSVDGIILWLIPSTDVIQLTLTLKMTTAEVVQTSVTDNNNSRIQDYVHPYDQTQPTFEMTPGMGSNLSQSYKYSSSENFGRFGIKREKKVIPRKVLIIFC